MKIFNFKAINKLLSYKEIDYNIDLQFKFIFLIKKIYELSREQTLIIKIYIDDIRQKNFIKHNFSLYVALILIVKKSNKNLRIYVNYQAFNNITIKNYNVSLLL